MTFHFRWCAKALAGVAVVSLIAACSSDLTGSDRHLVQLSATTRAAGVPAGNLTSGDPATAGEIVVNSVQLVFRKIELDRSGTAECIEDEEGDDSDDYGDDYGDRRHGDDDDDDDKGRRHDDDDGRDDDDDCEEVVGPTLVQVSGNDALQPIIAFMLAEGAFSELEAKLAPASIDGSPLLNGKSVRVVGTFTTGTEAPVSFAFTSRMRAKLELDLDPPLDDATTNATLNIDVRRWFRTSSGAFLDPTNNNNRRRIENNIRRSFRAFEDNDRRGDDHHRGHGGGDD